ncbi:MAG: T9SS type A sorting domain-containing protein [Ignavibacteriae bacterium]|nr:T9SS type A sorting domain-containing protein [Ignavibacteriota bacterium]
MTNHFYIQYVDSREYLSDNQIVLEIEGRPKIVFFEDGNFIVFQIINMNIGGEDSGIIYGEYLKYQKFNHDGQKLSDLVNLNYFSYPYKYGKYYYNFIPINNDKILSIWNEHNNIYLQNILESNNVKNPIYKITTNDSYSFQQNHDFTICNNGDLIIVYEEDRNGFDDVYLQKLDSMGNILGNGHSISEDSVKNIKKSPMIASSSNDYIMICWVESINDEEKMFAQIQNCNSEIVINKFEVLSLSGIETVKLNSFENKFIVSYNSSEGIICRIYSHEGKHLYTNLFNNYIENIDEKLKNWDIGNTKLGKYLFYYNCYDTSENINRVYGQFVDSLGNKLGEVFQINSNENLFDISDENTEKIPVSWLDKDNELNFRIVLSDGRFYSTVNYTEPWRWGGGGLPTIAIDENKNFIKYNKTHFQIFSDKGEKIESENEIYDLPISYDSATPVYKSKIIFKNNRLYIVREDLFELFDFDIKVKILELTKKITNLEGIQNVLPTTYALSQNYPNPFNPTTKIKYAIPQNEKGEKINVKIMVYDILGKEVETLVNENKSPGNYEVDFDASNLPSGVYFYKLQAGDYIQSRKMLLIK